MEFQKDCRRIAPGAKFDTNRPQHVMCPYCNKWYKVGHMFPPTRFKTHVTKECRVRPPGPPSPDRRNMDLMDVDSSSDSDDTDSSSDSEDLENTPGRPRQPDFGRAQHPSGLRFPLTQPIAVPALPPKMTASRGPCPGLTERNDPRIDAYFKRTSAAGGGAPNRKYLLPSLLDPVEWANRQFWITAPKLKLPVRERMLLEERRRFAWYNDKDRAAVYAQKCTGEAGEIGGPCAPCWELFRNQTFQKALRKTFPDKDTAKYAPDEYKGGVLTHLFQTYRGLENLYKPDGKTETTTLKFARMVMDPKTEGCDFLLGAMHSTYYIKEHEQAGKSLAGHVRSPIFTDIMHTIAILSPAAYKKLQPLVGGPTLRNLQYVLFPIDAFTGLS